MPKLNKLQKNFKKQMNKYDKKGLLPDSYKAKIRTVSFKENSDNPKHETNYLVGGCMHGCGFIIGKIIATIFFSIVGFILILVIISVLSKSL